MRRWDEAFDLALRELGANVQAPGELDHLFCSFARAGRECVARRRRSGRYTREYRVETVLSDDATGLRALKPMTLTRWSNRSRWARSMGLLPVVNTEDDTLCDIVFIDTSADRDMVERVLSPEARAAARELLLRHGGSLSIADEGRREIVWRITNADPAVARLDDGGLVQVVDLLGRFAEAMPSVRSLAKPRPRWELAVSLTCFALAMLGTFAWITTDGTWRRFERLSWAEVSVSAIGSLVVIATSYLLVRRKQSAHVWWPLVAVMATAALVTWVTTLGSVLNGALDEDPVTVEAVVRNKWIHTRRGSSAYWVTLELAEGRSDHTVSRDEFEDTPVGSRVFVRTGRGFFGWPWVRPNHVMMDPARAR